MAAVVACSSTPAPAGPPTTSAPAATTTRVTPPTTTSAGATCHLGSSPATYDPQSGDYATYLTKVNTTVRTVTFDVIQWLVGDAAITAYHKDHPDDPRGPPNDYYILNQSTRTYTAPVSPTVRVRLVRLGESANADLKPGTFDELPSYLRGYQNVSSPYLSPFPFWLTIDHGEVIDICEQYRP